MGSAAANALWRDKSARQAREPRKPRLRSAAVRHFLPGPCPSSLWNDSGCIEIVNGNCDFFLAKSWRAKSWGKTESWRDRIMGGQSQGNVGQGNGRGGKGRAGTPPRAPQPWRRGLPAVGHWQRKPRRTAVVRRAGNSPKDSRVDPLNPLSGPADTS
jgi:hypothetical protein